MASVDSNGRNDDRPRRRRRILVLLVVGATSLAGLLALAIGFRKPIVESLLLDELRRRTGETDTVAVSLDRLDRDQLALRGLRIGDALQISRLDARYSPTGLFASRFDAIRVSGLRLRGSLNASGISFGPLDAMIGAPSSDDSNSPTSLPALPTNRLELDDARIELVTPEGPLVVSLDSRVSQKSPRQWEAAVELSLEHRLATLKAALTATGEPEKWAGQISLDAALSGDFGPSVHIGDFTLSAHPTFAVEREQISIRADECAELRIDRLEIADGPRLTRSLELCVRSESVSINREGESAVDLVASIEPFSVDFGGGLEVFGEMPLLKIQGRQTSAGVISGSLSDDHGYVELPMKIGARGIHLEASTSPESEARLSTAPVSTPRAAVTRAELRIDSLFDPHQPTRFSELSLNASLVEVDASVGAPIEFDLEMADAERNVVIAIAGKHESKLGVGHASVRLQPFAFCPGGAELTSVLPILRGMVSGAQGSIEAKGTLAWAPEGARGKVDIALRDVNAKTEAFEIEHLNAAVSLLESGTPPGQLLSIGRIGFGLELTGGEVLFQILPAGQILLESAVWAFAGGELSTTGQLDPFAAQQALVFDVGGVDLAALLELVALEGLSGTGILEGRLPLYRNGAQIEIRDAELHSELDGGTIQYQPEPGAASLGASDEQIGVLLQILEDFHFTHLSLAINGDAAAEVVVAISLEGSNPGYQGGQLVHFNLSVDSRLSDLITKGDAAYQIPHLIEERFRAFSGRKVNLPASPCVHPPEALDDGTTQR